VSRCVEDCGSTHNNGQSYIASLQVTCPKRWWRN